MHKKVKRGFKVSLTIMAAFAVAAIIMIALGDWPHASWIVERAFEAIAEGAADAVSDA